MSKNIDFNSKRGEKHTLRTAEILKQNKEAHPPDRAETSGPRPCGIVAFPATRDAGPSEISESNRMAARSHIRSAAQASRLALFAGKRIRA